jgi:hypothetical protein
VSVYPPLQAARAALLTRRTLRQKYGHHTVGKARHEPLQAAYQLAGEFGDRRTSGYSPAVCGGFLYLRILYCPGCLRGHVVDLVRDLPANARMARELGLRQMRPWRLECYPPQA